MVEQHDKDKFEAMMKTLSAMTADHLSSTNPVMRMKARAMKGYGIAFNRWVAEIIEEIDESCDPHKRDETGRLLMEVISQVWAITMGSLISIAVKDNDVEGMIQLAREVMTNTSRFLADEVARIIMSDPDATK